MLVSGLALMAGVLASSGAQAQCTSNLPADGMQYFPFGAGSGVNALTSVISTVNTAFLTNGSAFVSESPAAGPDQQGGGVWIRAIGGTVDTQANSSFSGQMSGLDFSKGVPPQPYVATANDSCRTKVQQDFKGFQAGHDIALLNADNAGINWHFGGLAGYVESDFRRASGGTLNGNFNVPFAGLYTAFSKGNFFADAQARLDYFQGELTDQNNGISNERLDARGYSVTGNMGYRFDLGGNWSAEPSVGGVISRTWVDQLEVAGNNLPSPPFGQSAGTSSAGIVQINRVDSELGRASIKVGTTAALGSGIVAYPFASASVFHEFAGNVTASVSTAAGQAGTNCNGALTVGRVGTYGVFSVGSAFALADTGWLSYIRADYRTGDNIQGYSVTGGLRYQINPDTASLKEGGSSKDAPAEDYSWTGPYVGVSAGSTWGKASHWMNETYSLYPDNAGV